jgi:hypothetical protein
VLLRLAYLGMANVVFAVIERASRRIRIQGATAHPAASWVTQAARNFVDGRPTPS